MPSVNDRVAMAIYRVDGGMSDEDYLAATGRPRTPWDSLEEHEKDEFRTMAAEAIKTYRRIVFGPTV